VSAVATLSIVVPAHNEEDAIGDILDRILAQTDAIRATIREIGAVEVIVVNDGSSDRTAEIAGSYPGVRLMTHGENRGYGAALKTGIRAASGEVIGFLDADGTYPPEALPALVNELFRQRADIVTGSRMAGTRGGMPLVRWIGNRLFAALVSLVAHRRVTDSASGMRVVRREALARLGCLPDNMSFIVALSTQAMHEDLRTVDVPIAYDERVGRSKLRAVHDGLAFTRTILGIAALYNPLRVFAALGGTALGVALALAIRPLDAWWRLGVVPEEAIYRLVSVLVLLVGGFSITVFGVLATHALALVASDAPGAPPGRVERTLLSPRFPVPLVLAGLALMIFAPAVSYRAIAQFVATAHIAVHWSAILLGATSFLVGLQALLAGLLIALLERARQAKAGWL
jgi:hypothetical protein